MRSSMRPARRSTSPSAATTARYSGHRERAAAASAVRPGPVRGRLRPSRDARASRRLRGQPDLGSHPGRRMAGLGPAARRPCLPCAVALSPRLTAPSGCPDPGRPSPASPAIPRHGGGVDDDLHAKRHDLIQHRTQDPDLRYRQHGAPPVPAASGTAGSHHCPCRPGRTASAGAADVKGQPTT